MTKAGVASLSGWDLAIYALFVLWITGVTAVVLAVLRIVNGPVAKTIGGGKSLHATAMVIMESGKRVMATNREPIVALISHVRQINESVRLEAATTAFASEPVNLAKIASLIASIRMARSGLRSVTRFLNRKKSLPKLAARLQKPSIADRLGLLPPAARHVGPVIRIAKIALQTHRELRKRGIV